jgi:hypothetical protein
MEDAIVHYWEHENNVRGDKRLEKLADYIIDFLNLDRNAVLTKTNAKVPCYYRKSKNWDILVPNEIAIELKSMNKKSFSKNKNNRIEEAIGNVIDARKANPRMKFGYVIVLEKDEPHHFEKLQELYDVFMVIVTTDPQNYKKSY